MPNIAESVTLEFTFITIGIILTLTAVGVGLVKYFK